jgi:hypothetical protein
VRDRFVTSKKAWAQQNDAGRRTGSAAVAGEEEEEEYGDFEDLQTNTTYAPNGQQKRNSGTNSGSGSGSDSDSESDEEAANLRLDDEIRAMNATKKADHKRKANSQHDADKADKEGAVKFQGEEEEEEQKYLETLQKVCCMLYVVCLPVPVRLSQSH